MGGLLSKGLGGGSTISMKKSTAAISLVLIGSMAAINGCSSRDEDNEERRGGGSHGAHVGHMPIVHGGRTGGGGTATVGGSARGGFGSTGGSAHAGA